MGPEHDVAEPVRPWHRLNGEPSHAYGAFLLYRDLAPMNRTIIAAWRTQPGHERDRDHSTNWTRLRDRYEWEERTEAYDRHLEGVEDTAREAVTASEAEKWALRRMEQREKEHRVKNRIYNRLDEMLDHPMLMEKVETNDDDGTTTVFMVPAKWDYKSVAALAKAASEIGRLSADMKTQNVGLPLDDILAALANADPSLRRDVGAALLRLVSNRGD